MQQATITKSIRLSSTEAQELGLMSQQTALSEAALMKKWVLEGLRIEKLDRAIQAYMKRQVDLRTGAAMANVSYNRFVEEVQARNIVVLETDGFLDRLDALADLFDNPALRKAVEQVRTLDDDSNETPLT